jgi:NAD(P)H-hydrate repair Nnr-like enzyme with NAD(P)H-hydrate epimerase domain
VLFLAEDSDFSELNILVETYELMLDGVLGTGIKLPLSEDIGKVLLFVKEKISKFTNSLVHCRHDCPSE